MNDLTATEAAAELGLKPGSVRFLCWKKIIKAEKRGRDWFISREEVERYKQKRRQVGRPKTKDDRHATSTPETTPSQVSGKEKDAPFEAS